MTNANEMFEAYMNGFYGQIDDLTEELEKDGYEVLEANSEYIVVGYDDEDEDVQVELKLGGTERTIIITETTEVYRG